MKIVANMIQNRALEEVWATLRAVRGNVKEQEGTWRCRKEAKSRLDLRFPCHKLSMASLAIRATFLPFHVMAWCFIDNETIPEFYCYYYLWVCGSNKLATLFGFAASTSFFWKMVEEFFSVLSFLRTVCIFWWSPLTSKIFAIVVVCGLQHFGLLEITGGMLCSGSYKLLNRETKLPATCFGGGAMQPVWDVREINCVAVWYISHPGYGSIVRIHGVAFLRSEDLPLLARALLWNVSA